MSEEVLPVDFLDYRHPVLTFRVTFDSKCLFLNIRYRRALNVTSFMCSVLRRTVCVVGNEHHTSKSFGVSPFLAMNNVLQFRYE